MSTDSKLQIVRPASAQTGRQGLQYAVGISAESVGSRALHLQLATIPAGASARAHKHPGHETAIYAMRGGSGCWYGDALEQHVWLEQGEFLYIPADVVHMPYNPSDTDEVVVLIARTDPCEQEHVVLLPELDALEHLEHRPDPSVGGVLEQCSDRSASHGG